MIFYYLDNMRASGVLECVLRIKELVVKRQCHPLRLGSHKVWGIIMAYADHYRTSRRIAVAGEEQCCSQRYSLREFFIEAVRSKLAPERRKVRKAPPVIGDRHAPQVKALTREQLDEAMFG